MIRSPLDPLLARFTSRRPVRAGSLIVTLYGDAILPRGGALWLGSINTLMAPFGIGSGLVRTAMSRLVAEGLFERTRAGRNSYFRLSQQAAAEFAAAGQRIYRHREPAWDGTFTLAVLTSDDVKERQSLRDVLLTQGFGQLAPHILVRPATGAGPEPSADLPLVLLNSRVVAGGDPRRLVASQAHLAELARGYHDLIDDLRRVGRNLGRQATPSDELAFQVRLLLIHEWRRLVLRDPQLPRALLPDDWPGETARAAVRDIYRRVRAAAERWLDLHGLNEHGPLPPADAAAEQRFGGADQVQAGSAGTRGEIRYTKNCNE